MVICEVDVGFGVLCPVSHIEWLCIVNVLLYSFLPTGLQPLCWVCRLSLQPLGRNILDLSRCQNGSREILLILKT